MKAPIIEIKIEPINAEKNPCISKPLTRAATNININEFSIKRKKPSDTTVIGKVRTISSGLIKAFTNPRIKAATKAAINPRTSIPGMT